MMLAYKIDMVIYGTCGHMQYTFVFATPLPIPEEMHELFNQIHCKNDNSLCACIHVIVAT